MVIRLCFVFSYFLSIFAALFCLSCKRKEKKRTHLFLGSFFPCSCVFMAVLKTVLLKSLVLLFWLSLCSFINYCCSLLPPTCYLLFFLCSCVFIAVSKRVLLNSLVLLFCYFSMPFFISFCCLLSVSEKKRPSCFLVAFHVFFVFLWLLQVALFNSHVGRGNTPFSRYWVTNPGVKCESNMTIFSSVQVFVK